MMQEKFEERLRSLNARLAAMEGEQLREEEDILDMAKRRLQVLTISLASVQVRRKDSS